MKEYIYQVEHRWEKQRQPINVDQRQYRRAIVSHDEIDLDASSFLETTSESGVSDLETSINDCRCTCCPYGYHLDTDFVKFLDQMYGPDVLRTLKKIDRKRHDLRRRLVREQSPHRPVSYSSSTRNSVSTDNNEMIRETILEFDRIVERDIQDLEAQCQRHERARSVDSRQHQHYHQHQHHHHHHRPPPPPPPPPAPSFRTAEERRLHEHRYESERIVTNRTHSVPRLNVQTIRKFDTSTGGPIAFLHNIPPPAVSRSSSSSSLSTETTLRVSSPEPDDQPVEPLKPLYITEIMVPAKPTVHVHEPIKTTVVRVTDRSEIERRNREIERLENERRSLLSEKEVLLREIERYKRENLRPITRVSTSSINVTTTKDEHHIKPSTREVSMQHMVIEENESLVPPPLPPKQRIQRDVAINHRTEYDDDDGEQQTEIVRRKLEEIKNVYSERIHFLEEKISEQEKEIEQLSQPKPQRHVNTQCQPTMQDRALVTDTFRSVRDVALTCHLLPEPVPHRDVNLQCNTDEFIQKRDVSMEAIPDRIVQRDVAIGVALDVQPDRHFRDVGTHVNFDYKPEVRQRDVAIMFAPAVTQKQDRASNTPFIQSRDIAISVNTIEPPKPPPKPVTRVIATDTSNLITYIDAACGQNEPLNRREMSMDTENLLVRHDRACGMDIPRELLARHVSTDTRTLISTRENFSLTTPPQTISHLDAQTQSIPLIQHDVSSNTNAPAEYQHTGVQAIEEQAKMKHNSTTTELNIFHQLGHLRHNLSNTDSRRSTDRSTITDRQQFRELAVNTEPKIMYSKDVGDSDVRHRLRTFDSSLQTDLFDTKRTVGYLDDREDLVEEQRQEIITFRLPIEERTTEEIYETTITTEKKENVEEIRTKRRSQSPEQLIEESYEVVSTLTKPKDGQFLVTGTNPGVVQIQRYADRTTTTFDQSNPYSEHWKITENKTSDKSTTSESHLSPTSILKSSTYESHRRVLPVGSSSTFTRTTDDNDQADIEENYQVTLTSSELDFDQQLNIACGIVNQSLYDSTIDSTKVNQALQVIQHEWFRICMPKDLYGRSMEKFLLYIKENFSNFLLERVINLQDNNGNTALHYCVSHGSWHLVNLLLDTNVCDVCIQNRAGYTAVMRAAVIDINDNDQREIVRRLFRESGNVNVQTKETQQTALMLAVKHGKADLVELLLNNGAAVNLQDSDGSTALMFAVEHGLLNIVKLLLNRSECDVNIVDKHGQTAISIAQAKNRKNILVALYAKKNPSIQSNRFHRSSSNRSPMTTTNATASSTSKRTLANSSILSNLRRTSLSKK